jgi:hypothetical protein
MCQQWLSVLGLLADVAGFLLIAWEWYRAFTHSVHMRSEELHDAEERRQAREEGREHVKGMQWEDEEMARLFSRLHNAEASFRRWLFLLGCGLVILGFLLQSAGSWPGSDPIFGFRNC